MIHNNHVANLRTNMLKVLIDIDDELKSILLYEPVNDDIYDTVKQISDQFNKSLREHNIIIHR